MVKHNMWRVLSNVVCVNFVNVLCFINVLCFNNVLCFINNETQHKSDVVFHHHKVVIITKFTQVWRVMTHTRRGVCQHGLPCKWVTIIRRGLFCKRAIEKRLYSAEATYNFTRQMLCFNIVFLLNEFAVYILYIHARSILHYTSCVSYASAYRVAKTHRMP